MIKSHRQGNKHGQNDLKLRKIFIEYLMSIQNDVIQKVHIQTHRLSDHGLLNLELL